jgi:hypothetical protein
MMRKSGWTLKEGREGMVLERKDKKDKEEEDKRG